MLSGRGVQELHRLPSDLTMFPNVRQIRRPALTLHVIELERFRERERGRDTPAMTREGTFVFDFLLPKCLLLNSFHLML